MAGSRFTGRFHRVVMCVLCCMNSSCVGASAVRTQWLICLHPRGHSVTASTCRAMPPIARGTSHSTKPIDGLTAIAPDRCHVQVPTFCSSVGAASLWPSHQDMVQPCIRGRVRTRLVLCICIGSIGYSYGGILPESQSLLRPLESTRAHPVHPDTTALSPTLLASPRAHTHLPSIIFTYPSRAFLRLVWL